TVGDFLQTLRARARTLGRALVFAEGTDPRVQQATAELIGERLVTPVLLGPPDAVRDGLTAAGVGAPAGVQVVDPGDPAEGESYARQLLGLRAGRKMTEEDARRRVADPLWFAALMVARGDVDGCVAGLASPTRDVLRAGVRCIGMQEG